MSKFSQKKSGLWSSLTPLPIFRPVQTFPNANKINHSLTYYLYLLLRCDLGSLAACWLGDLCMPEGSVCPPSCNIPAPSQCLDGEVICDMGTSAEGCWLGDLCMPEGSECPNSVQTTTLAPGEILGQLSYKKLSHLSQIICVRLGHTFLRPESIFILKV